MTSEKTTKARRSHEDSCAAAHAPDLEGDRWAPLVVREPMPAPRRFADPRAGLPGIGANVLTQRLEEMETHGIVRRHRLPPPATARLAERFVTLFPLPPKAPSPPETDPA